MSKHPAASGLSFLALLAIVAPFVGQARSDTPPTPTQKEAIKELIEQLGSDDFKQREAASAKLAEREEAMPAHRQALHSPDLEVRARVKRLMGRLRAKQAALVLKGMKALCKEGAADRVVEQMVALKDVVKDESWQDVLGLAEAVVKAAGVKGKHNSVPGSTLMKNRAWRDGARVGHLVVHERLIADRIQLTSHIVDAAVVCGGAVQTASHVVRSVLFVNGDMKTDSAVIGSLIVCDGDVEALTLVDSVIVARGTIKVPGIMQNSAALCHGDMESPAIVQDSLIVTRGTVKVRVGGSITRNSVVKQGERKPSWGITFLDPGTLGIDLAPEGGGMKVKVVRNGKPFARAGLMKDDVVTHICGVKADSLRTCRRLLRDALEDRGAVLQVRRGKTQFEVTVGLEK
jgi:hypothetical protein